MKRKNVSIGERNWIFGSTVRQINWTLYSRAGDGVEELFYLFFSLSCRHRIEVQYDGDKTNFRDSIHLPNSSNVLCLLRISCEISVNATAANNNKIAYLP